MTLGPLMIDLIGTELQSDERELLRHPLVGGVILFTRNFVDREQIQSLVREIRAARTPPVLVAVDYEGGRVQRFRRDFTMLPPMRTLGHAYEMRRGDGLKLARQCGWLLAAELRAVGVDLSFGPVVDLDYGASGVIGDRALHRDPRVVAELALALMQGMRDAGMAAVAKHFPGHGAVVADSHVALPVDRREYADLADDLYPYERLFDNGLPAVMAAHVVFANVDPLPASCSPRWLKAELRDRLGFQGAVFSDDLNMEGASVMGDMPQRAKAALQAGCDMVPICNNRDGVLQTLRELGECSDPVSQVRLIRLHGVTAPGTEQLLASAEWQDAAAAIDGCRQPPPLKLDA